MPEKSKAKVRLVTRGKSKSSSTATLRVRKIRHSPVADPKKVKLVRQIVRELNQAKKSPKGAAQAPKPRPEIPFVTPAH